MNEKVSPSEWKVLEVLWDMGTSYSNEIVKSLDSTNWSDKTIKTLISRLVKKEIISFTKEGKSYKYFPLLDKDALVMSESQDFVQRVFGGSMQAFMTNMIKHNSLSPDEIKELKSLLDKEDK